MFKKCKETNALSSLIACTGCLHCAVQSNSDTVNTDGRLAAVKDAALMMQTLQTGLGEIVVRFSQWSNCLVTDPVFDLTGLVPFLTHP